MNRRRFLKTAGLGTVGLVSGCKTIEEYLKKSNVIRQINMRIVNYDDIEFIKTLSDYQYTADYKITTEGYGEQEKAGIGIAVDDHYLSVGHIAIPIVSIFGMSIPSVVSKREVFLKGRKLDEVIVENEKREDIFYDKAVYKIPKKDGYEADDIHNFPCKPSSEFKLFDLVALGGNPMMDGFNYRIGMITDVDGLTNFNQSVGLDIASLGGDSGGYVVHIKNRTLLGLLFVGQGGLSYFKKIDVFMEYVK